MGDFVLVSYDQPLGMFQLNRRVEAAGIVAVGLYNTMTTPQQLPPGTVRIRVIASS
jgi:hypothetical protein